MAGLWSVEPHAQLAALPKVRRGLQIYVVSAAAGCGIRLSRNQVPFFSVENQSAHVKMMASVLSSFELATENSFTQSSVHCLRLRHAGELIRITLQRYYAPHRRSLRVNQHNAAFD